MADRRGKARVRHPSGPRLPKSVAGLMEAMRAVVAGDCRSLEAWDRGRFPILKDIVGTWARDTDLGDRLACRIVSEAFRVVSAGQEEIRSELAWMASVALRGRAEILTREAPSNPLPADVRASAAEPIEELIRQEGREQVRRAIRILPTRHRLPMTLHYIVGLSEAEVAAYLKSGRGIGLPATRWLLKEGREMVKLILNGGDPRKAFPARYARDRRKSEKSDPETYPPSPLSGT